jgi:VIT1/CCC1 family predicted Fe2+/Mn2+ transporter
MIKKFEKKGINNNDAELIVNKLSQYESFFVDFLIGNDLGLQISDDSDAYLITDSFFLGLSYAFFGMLPIIIYSFAYFEIKLLTFSNNDIFYISMFITLILLFALGSSKSSFSMVSFWVIGIESLLIGLLYGSIAFLLSSTISNFVS